MGIGAFVIELNQITSLFSTFRVNRGMLLRSRFKIQIGQLDTEWKLYYFGDMLWIHRFQSNTLSI